jgi:ABC-2 type transport system ATP-binding protein
LHRPAVLFLDEPTLGLDPQTRARTWEYIRKMAQKEETTVVLTTHYMEEAEAMCNRIGIMDTGRIIALDTPENMIDTLGGDIVAINAPQPPLDIIRSLPYVSAVKIAGETTEITMKSAHLHLAELLPLIPGVVSVEMRKPTLNDVFIKLTGRDIRVDAIESGESWVDSVARYRQRGK